MKRGIDQLPGFFAWDVHHMRELVYPTALLPRYPIAGQGGHGLWERDWGEGGTIRGFPAQGNFDKNDGDARRKF